MSTARVGVMGDSHCQGAEQLDASVSAALEGCDYIVHLGDLSTSDVLDHLERIAPVIGVASTTDPEDPRLHGTATRLDVADRRIAIRRSLGEGETFDADVDVVVHGGTHDHSVQVRGPLLFVNPGSTRWATRQPSLAILDITPDAIGVEVIPLTDG